MFYIFVNRQTLLTHDPARAWTHIDFEVLAGRNINSPVNVAFIREYQVFL